MNTWFWTAAFVLMAVIIGLGLLGWRAIRRGDARAHRLYLTWAIRLILFFVAAYVVKVFALGREHLDHWPARDVLILRIHETCVAVMLLAGTGARLLARKFEVTDGVPGGHSKRHRIFGRTALIGGVLALLTALMVLFGMYQRRAAAGSADVAEAQPNATLSAPAPSDTGRSMADGAP